MPSIQAGFLLIRELIKIQQTFIESIMPGIHPAASPNLFFITLNAATAATDKILFHFG